VHLLGEDLVEEIVDAEERERLCLSDTLTERIAVDWSNQHFGHLVYPSGAMDGIRVWSGEPLPGQGTTVAAHDVTVEAAAVASGAADQVGQPRPILRQRSQHGTQSVPRERGIFKGISRVPVRA
jgi:hypothetical protein